MELPEQQLLLIVARKQMNPADQLRLRQLLATPINLPLLSEFARQHGLLPLLYRHLTSTCRELVPPPFLENLRLEFESNNARNLFMMRELLCILKLTRAHKIDALTLKGPLLAERVYGDLGLRTVADIDLLVRKNEFYAVADLLQRAGYVMEPQLDPPQMAKHLEFHCEIQFIHPEHECVVDLHWALAPQSFKGALSTNAVFSRRQQVTAGGKAVDILNNEDQLLFLSMHAAKHYWSRLEWFAGIAELLRDTNSFNCATLLSRAREARALTMLLLATAVVKDLFELQLPAELDLALNRKPSIASRADFIRQRLFHEAGPLGPWQMFRMNLLAMDRRSDAVVALFRSAFTPTISDWELISFPKPLYAIYYLLRPVRLVNKYLARVVTKPLQVAKTDKQPALTQEVFNR